METQYCDITSCSDHRDAFTLAFKLLWNRSRECEPLILFLTDGEESDPVLCRPPTYFGTEEGVLFVPGPHCVYDFNQVYEHVNRLETDYTQTFGRNEIKIIGFALSETATTLPYNISCSHGGFGLKITNNLSIYSQLSQYFTYTNQNTTQIVLLNPYGGRDGQLILTAVKSVYSQCGGVNRLIGVIGVDYSLSAVQVVLSKGRSDNSYAFIINRFGEALFHPRIDPIARLIPNPIYPPLSSLESCPRNSNISLCSDNPSILDVEEIILLSRNKTGDFKVLNVPRVTLRGDHQDGVEWKIGNSNYFYAPIQETSFILGLNLEDSFLDQFVLSSLPIDENYTQPFYNIFSEYSQETLDTFGLEPPNFCATSSTPFNIATNQSLIVLAPISVCNPSDFRINNIPGPLTVYNYFSNFLNKTITDLLEGCKTETEFFRDRLLSSILLTSLLGGKWQETNASGIIWRYIGLENGVLRILPGVEIGTDYDPTVRPWYRRAIAQKNMLAISYVYLDAGGAGKTVTLSRAIFTGPPSPLNITNCTEAGCYCSTNEECISRSCIPDLQVCSSDRIAGVTAFDYTYTEFSNTFYSYLNSLNTFNCSKVNNCYLYIFDSQTFLILANEILDADPADTNAYERISLGRMQPEVVRDLVDSKGLLVEEYSFDFQSSCLYSSYFLPATEDNLTLLNDNGLFAPYQNEYSCLQTVRNFYINSTLLDSHNGTIYGTISSINNCRYGDYYVSAISGTNAFLLVLNNWTNSMECPLDLLAQSGPTLNLTGGTQCPALFSQIQITTSYSCSTPIHTPQCDPTSGGMSAYDYLCPEMDYVNRGDYIFEESIFVSRLPPQIFSERCQGLRDYLERLFRRYGDNLTFHYLTSISKVCVVFHRPGEAELAREELDSTSFLNFGTIRVESLRLITAPWDERHLKVPKSQRRFLLSPPSSPPVGWEPIEEPPPVPASAIESALLDLICSPGEHIDLFEPEDPSHPTIRLETVIEADQSDYSLSVANIRTCRPNY
ncbi:hypothetical protein LOD99_13904 [Oopsacas minuta]|uniref:VWFA domain-containing protein n=1 Tax=Oopsacas minuta TaxID=111878 RepID=A0AAV7KHF6_9METZ|nr:hypothetical protein LOD99_13904 [Oopsacas minuta]